MPQNILTAFPYHETPDGGFFPVIPLKLRYQKEVVETFALIDSGATISIFRPEVAEQLGVKIENGKEIYLTGVGGRIKDYLHRLKIEVADKKFVCPIIFSYEFTVSFNLLGREKFFKNFVIIFDEKKKEIRLE